MERFTDYDKWRSELYKATTYLDEVKHAMPKWYEFFEELVKLRENNWTIQGTRHTSQIQNIDVYEETIKKWMEFSEEENKKIWEFVGYHNRSNPYNEHRQFKVDKIHAMMQRLKGK